MLLHWNDRIGIEISDSYAYKWASCGKTFVRGYFLLNDRFMSAAEAVVYLNSLRTVKEIQQTLPCLEGAYNIIVQRNDGFLACADPVRSMPLFYQETQEGLVLYDTLESKRASIEDIDANALVLYHHALFTVGNKTLLKNICQIPAGNFLLYQNGQIRLAPHFIYQYQPSNELITNISTAVELLDSTYLKTFQHLVQLLDGRTAVLPLSGGHDSRLIAYYLKERLGYQNIIAYSYGSPDGFARMEAVVSKQVAQTLGIPWHYVSQDPDQMHGLFQQEYSSFAAQAGNFCSVPCLQEWYSIYELKKRSVLSSNSVLVPGYSGDFLAGTHLLKQADQEKVYHSEEILQYLREHYFSERKDFPQELVSHLYDELIAEYPVLGEKERTFGLNEANELIERFDNDNRQAKFIVNAVRVHDYFGYQWAIPFFEREQYRVWSQMDNSLRYHRKAFFALEHAIYPSKLQQIPFEKDPIDPWIVRRLKMLKYGASYSHYIYGYYHLGVTYYRDALRKKLKSVNMYAQDSYLNSILGRTEG